MKKLKQFFLAVFLVLGAQALWADSLSLPTTMVDGQECYYHVVQKGETVYGIAKQLGITVDAVVANNKLENNRLTVGQQLYFPVAQFSKFTKVEPIQNTGKKNKNDEQQEIVDGMLIYKMRNNESIFSVAMKHHVTVESIRQANPKTKVFKKGAKIRIPLAEADVYDMPAEEPVIVEEVKEPVFPHYYVRDTLNVALILPLMVNAAEPDAQALNHTEFCKGFMMAVDTVRQETKRQINVHIIDTQCSDSVVTTIFANPDLATMHAIVAPGDNTFVSKASEFGQEHEVAIFNLFNIRDTKYRTDSLMFQCNAPSANMNGYVAKWFREKFSDYAVVMLEREIENSKDFYFELRDSIMRGGMENVTLSGSEVNATAIGNMLMPGKKYVFVPSLSTKKFLTHAIKCLRDLKISRPDVELCLFGYPEYMTFTTDADCTDGMHAIDTYFYTRYYYNSQDYFTQKLENSYHRWYNENMRYSSPKMGILGFDSGVFILRAMLGNEIYNGHINKYNGLQTDFDFERVGESGGYFNKSVKIIRFTPYGSIEKM